MAGEPGYTVDEARTDAHEWSTGVQIGSRGWRACGRILDARITELEAALRSVIGDIEEYERINNLSPSPGKPDCWQSVAHAKAVLANN
jgi:hypothetical protein